MKENNSPWLYQLARTRPETPLSENIETDVLIVGGGIAGVSTLYYTLKHTDRNVCLLEAKRVAHGATGHNAGYVVSDFEKPLQDIIGEYGKEKALAGVAAIESAWTLFEELATIAGDALPLERVTSYGGYAHREQFVAHLENRYLTKDVAPIPGKVLVAKESGWMDELPSHLRDWCEAVSKEAIREALETREDLYLGAIPEKTIVTNSALLTDRVLLHCLATYPDRVSLYEFSPVHGIELDHKKGRAISGECTVSFREIVLATNGFEDFYLRNNTGVEVDIGFHHEVKGVVGYMTGYLATEPPHSAAMYFYPHEKISSDPYAADPYFYITRRDFKTDSHSKLISIGGPEVHLDYRERYFHDYDVSEEIYQSIDDFLEQKEGARRYEKKFRWHGLMGYTVSGLRLIGREPANPILLYNLGCNGIGILTSIYGGKKIADHLAGLDVPPSIFDPKAKTL